VSVNCVICGVRKARRACPGVHGEICTICCGTEREQTIDCPLECEYLRHAHEHENTAEVPENALPDVGVLVEEDFIKQYEWVLMLVGSAIVDGYKEFPAATDFDAREALDALVKSWKTLESGLVYEARPANPYAAAMCDAVRARVADIQARLAENGEPGYLPDSAVLKLLIFLRRLEYLDNNGRKRSRAFLDMLNRSYVSPPAAETSGDAGLIESADAPLVIL
jgi:hypothetical protein